MDLDSATEEETARALVLRRLRTDRGRRPEATFRRLVGMLARKGYPPGLAFRVVKEALAARPDTGDALREMPVDAWESAVDDLEN